MTTFSYTTKYLLKDNVPWFPIMGEFHYSRYPKKDWKKELYKMKAGGVDVVSSYVIWIHHEEIEGDYDFEGNKDLRYFIQLCKECGVYFFLRFGPWSHAEVRNGGFPDWLLAKHKDKVRTNDEAYFKDVEKYYTRIYEEVHDLFIKDGGPIIGIQIDNEFGHCGGLQGDEGQYHMQHLTQIARKIGYDVPFFTATGWGGAITGGLLPVMGGYCDEPWAQHINKLAPSTNYVITYERNDHGIGSDHHIGYGTTFKYEDFPYLTAELGGGLQVTKLRRTVALGSDIGAMSLTKLASGCNLLGYYMYHGGTNPHGKLSTLQESRMTGSLNDLPEYSYDFNAPLKEYGQVSDNFKEIKLLAMFIKDFGEEFCKMETYIPESVPDKSTDLESLRYSIRHNGNCGYVFVNNYQRLYEMRSHTHTFEVKLDNQTITLPEIKIEDKDYFFYPVNMRVGEATLSYITASPLCKINDSYVFYSDKEVQYELDQEANLCILSKQEALNAYKIHLDKDYLVITESLITENGNGYEVHSDSTISLKVYPDFKTTPNGFTKVSSVDGFAIYEKTITKETPTINYKPLTEGESKKYLVTTSIPVCDECYVTIHYQGDNSKLYINNTLEDDDFYTGLGWTTGLSRYNFPTSFEVEIYPMLESDEVYVEYPPKFVDGVACDIGEVTISCEYITALEF